MLSFDKAKLNISNGFRKYGIVIMLSVIITILTVYICDLFVLLKIPTEDLEKIKTGAMIVFVVNIGFTLVGIARVKYNEIKRKYRKSVQEE